MPEESSLPSTAPSLGRLHELIGAMEGRPVAMLVDLVADRFIAGVPRRISREAPVLILSHSGEEVIPGGGGNAAANVAALGGRPLAVGAVGDDANGRELLGVLAQRGVHTGRVLVREGYRTPTKVRILAGGRHSIKQQIVRYDIEDPTPLGEAQKAALLERWNDACRTGSPAAAVVSDYGYGAAAPDQLGALRAPLPAGCPLLCDSRYRLGEMDGSGAGGADGATPNEEEAEALLGSPLGDDGPTAARHGQALRDRLGVRFLLVTRGSHGMMLVEAGRVAHLPVHGTDQVADVTGAGDTVIGTFALSLAAGASPLEAALLANYAGGVVVMKTGTATVSRDELTAAVTADPRPREEFTWVAG